MLSLLLVVFGVVVCDFEKKMILETHESVSNFEYLTRTLPPIELHPRETLDLNSVGYPVA